MGKRKVKKDPPNSARTYDLPGECNRLRAEGKIISAWEVGRTSAEWIIYFYSVPVRQVELFA